MQVPLYDCMDSALFGVITWNPALFHADGRLRNVDIAKDAASVIGVPVRDAPVFRSVSVDPKAPVFKAFGKLGHVTQAVVVQSPKSIAQSFPFAEVDDINLTYPPEVANMVLAHEEARVGIIGCRLECAAPKMPGYIKFGVLSDPTTGELVLPHKRGNPAAEVDETVRSVLRGVVPAFKMKAKRFTILRDAVGGSTFVAHIIDLPAEDGLLSFYTLPELIERKTASWTIGVIQQFLSSIGAAPNPSLGYQPYDWANVVAYIASRLDSLVGGTSFSDLLYGFRLAYSREEALAHRVYVSCCFRGGPVGPGESAMLPMTITSGDTELWFTLVAPNGNWFLSVAHALVYLHLHAQVMYPRSLPHLACGRVPLFQGVGRSYWDFLPVIHGGILAPPKNTPATGGSSMLTVSKHDALPAIALATLVYFDTYAAHPVFHTGDGYSPYYKLWWALSCHRVAIPSKYGSSESAKEFVRTCMDKGECLFFFGTEAPPPATSFDLHSMVPMKKEKRSEFLTKCVRFWFHFKGPTPPLHEKVAVARVSP